MSAEQSLVEGGKYVPQIAPNCAGLYWLVCGFLNAQKCCYLILS